MAMASLNKREQRAILLIGILGVLVFWFYGGYAMGLAKDLSSLKEGVATAEHKVLILENSTAKETALRRQLAQLQQVVERLQKTLPVEDDLPVVIEFLSSLASQTNVRVQTIFPQRMLTPDNVVEDIKKRRGLSDNEEVGEVYYKEVPIQIDVLAGYHQIGMFLSMMENSGRPLRLVSLRISGNPRELKRHIAQVVIQSYFKAEVVEKAAAN